MANAALKVKSIVQVDDLGWWQDVLFNTKIWCPGKCTVTFEVQGKSPRFTGRMRPAKHPGK